MAEVLDTSRLRDLLTASGDLDRVSLDGERADDTFVLERRGAGWLVFFWERGVKRGFRKHGSEESACRDLLNRIAP